MEKAAQTPNGAPHRRRRRRPAGNGSAPQAQQPAAQPSMSGYPQPIPDAAAQYPTPDFSGVPDSYAWGPGGTPINDPPF